MAENTAPEMKPTLGLTGLTMNAMALIAPGAFLWLTFLHPGHHRSHGAFDVDRDLHRLAALPGDGGLLCRNGQAVPRHGEFLLLRRTIVPEPRQGVALCAHFQVHRGLGLAPLLLDLSRGDGGHHGNLLRLPGGDPVAEFHERFQSRTRCS